MICLHLIIRGRVQGVGFRAATKKMADLLRVNGYVFNTPDGHVEVEAEGEDTYVYKLVDFCHHGPPNATVEKVSILTGNIRGYTSFDIR